MKNFSHTSCVFLTLLVIACHDSKDGSQNPATDVSQFTKVGALIPMETGLRWIESYQQKMHEAGRTTSQEFGISSVSLQSMLSSAEGYVGVAFHYALDESGVAHILAIPVDVSLSLWSASSRLIVDLNTGEPITEATAYDWAKRFKDANPGQIWFHFFGKHVFDEIMLLPYFNSLDVERAIDDVNLTPELLLIVWEEESTNGRSRSSSGAVYDASNPCPPCPVN